MSFTWDFVGRLVLRCTSPRNMSIATHRNYTFNLNPIVRHGCSIDALRTPSTSAPETGRPTPRIAYNATPATADYTVWRQLWSLTTKAHRARARSLAMFIPHANEDFGIFCIITLPIKKLPTNDICYSINILLFNDHALRLKIFTIF